MSRSSPSCAKEKAQSSASLEEIIGNILNSYHAEKNVYARALEIFEKPLILRVLSLTQGNQLRAAEILGLNRNTLRKKIHDLGITYVKGRGDDVQ